MSEPVHVDHANLKKRIKDAIEDAGCKLKGNPDGEEAEEHDWSYITGYLGAYVRSLIEADRAQRHSDERSVR